jgi:hypothetical protein
MQEKISKGGKESASWAQKAFKRSAAMKMPILKALI